GDVNLDGELDINDATTISKHLVDMIKLDGKALAVADVNGDAEIDINDVTCIQKYLAGYSRYGNCGQKLVG
ncbi:MAG: dockerin type I repeat-containing protein, partial [Ruminococcus sp.]|nr:dockerin type I repeat-containing protein [Ruminococcus sp.]